MTITVVVALVLLIACANIANLLLARSTARRHELSVRVALGASRLRVARQLLAESLLLSAAGALLGFVLAQWGSRLLVRQLSTTTTDVFLDLRIDWRMLAFTAAVAITTAIFFGTVPALRATRVQPNEAMKQQGRGIAGDGRLGISNVLVVLQVALSLVLIVAASLFMRTLSSLANLDLGFERDKVLVASINIQRLKIEPAARPALFERLRQAAAAVPGVSSAAASAVTPVSGSSWQYLIEMPNAAPLSERERAVHVNIISPGWFRTYGTRMLAGRDFTDTDKTGGPNVAIVNEAFARKFTEGLNPTGQHVRLPGFPNHPEIAREIVGYAQDAIYRSLRQPVPPTMYVPIPQQPEPPSYISVSVRAAAGSPTQLTKSLAAALTDVNRDIAITFSPLADQVNASLVQERVVAMLAGFFGVLALLLAGLGMYGVTAYAVSRRRTEIGIRMALGAAPGGIIRLVLARVALLVGVGVIVGGAVSLWASQFVATLLYGVQPGDPATILFATIVLGSIGGMAGWVPARRAARIDPARVLQEA